jgi:hypothetical protein
MEIEEVILGFTSHGQRYNPVKIKEVGKLGTKYIVATEKFSSVTGPSLGPNILWMTFHIDPRRTECFYSWVDGHTLTGETLYFDVNDKKLTAIYHYDREGRNVLLLVDFNRKTVTRFSISDTKAGMIGLFD